MFLVALFASLGNKLVTPTGYYPQRFGNSERHSRTFVPKLGQYIDKHQHDSDVFLQYLSYTNNKQVHIATRRLQFELTLSRKPPQFFMLTGPKNESEKYDLLAPSRAKTKISYRPLDFLRRADDMWNQAQRRNKIPFHKKVSYLKTFCVQFLHLNGKTFGMGSESNRDNINRQPVCDAEPR